MQRPQQNRRKIELIQNLDPIHVGQLPEFGIKNKIPATQFSPPGTNNLQPNPEQPSFNISGLPETPSAMPALDFKSMQRQQVADHIARDTRQREAEREEKNNTPPPEPIIVREPVVKTPIPQNLKNKYSRVYLPSQGVLGFDSVFIRPLDSEELMLLHEVRVSGSETALFDTLDRCIADVDIRDLCLGDFRFIFYWLKIQSFTRNPYTVRFISKYGNKNVVSIGMTDLVIKALEIDDDDFDYYKEKGFVIPTLRDGEALNRFMSAIPEKTPEEKKAKDAIFYRCTYAQYVQGNSIEEKLENLRTKYEPDDWVDIMEFANIIKDFGVEETIKVTDKHFEADKALEYLKNGIEEIEKMDLIKINQPDLLELINTNKSRIQEEITRIETEIANTGEAAATSETVTFSLSLDDFFPENIAKAS